MSGLLAELLVAYAATVAVETPTLWFGLARHHPARTRLLAGVLLSAATLPIVWLVLPTVLITSVGETATIAVAEAFAPVAECGLFRLMVGATMTRRDTAAIVTANLLSFAAGLLA